MPTGALSNDTLNLNFELLCGIFDKMATGNSKNRPHKTLTIDEKGEILDQFGKKTYTVISEEYGIMNYI